CDDSDIKTGKPKDPGIARATYSKAQKMRFLVSFYGNPSISTAVSQYMISLRRNKVRGGEVVTSARAMDEPTMKKLWTYNTGFPVESSTSYGSTSKSVSKNIQKIGPALRITWQDVTFDMETGVLRIRLDLPFRKTHQNGGITPFYLYANPDRPWMCPSTDSFIEYFRNNLLDIDIDPRPYGTHSFRRENFDNPGTLFKYLLSWTDTPLLEREDYLNPSRPVGDVCAACNRSCHCS
ncbi:hypothetical protein B0H14DRAFT_2820105, partial [Mycena olivaceomarginata]